MTIAIRTAGALLLLAALMPVPALAADCAIALPPGFNGAAAAGAGAAPQVVVQGLTGETGTAAIASATRFNLGSVGKILPAAGIAPQPLGRQADDAAGVDPAEQDFADAITRVRPWPAGGIVLSAADLWRFGRALADGRLVRPDTLEAMMRGGVELRAATPERPGSRYGLGLGVSGDGAARVIGHTGGAPGIDVSLRIHPASGRVVAVMSNHSGSDEWNASTIARAILAEQESGRCAEPSRAAGTQP